MGRTPNLAFVNDSLMRANAQVQEFYERNKVGLEMAFNVAKRAASCIESQKSHLSALLDTARIRNEPVYPGIPTGNDLMTEDFYFDQAGLYLEYKSKRISNLNRVEMIICGKIFAEEAGYQFSTVELEDLAYPNEAGDTTAARRMKFKKALQRLNHKIFKEAGRKIFKYKSDFISRDM